MELTAGYGSPDPGRCDDSRPAPPRPGHAPHGGLEGPRAVHVQGPIVTLDTPGWACKAQQT